MWPLGTYDRFLRKIKGQELSQEKANYFGVLFCDVRQTNARDYILNYLDVFNKKSGKFIDFYIPGYIPSTEYYGTQNCNVIHIGKHKYIFDQSRYIEFCERFEHDFNIDFPFSATLVLLEYTKIDYLIMYLIVHNSSSSSAYFAAFPYGLALLRFNNIM